MSRARTLAGAIGSDGALNVADVAGLAAVASSGSASDLSTGTLPIARIADGAVTSAKIADATIATGDIADGAIVSSKLASGAAVANIGYTPTRRFETGAVGGTLSGTRWLRVASLEGRWTYRVSCITTGGWYTPGIVQFTVHRSWGNDLYVGDVLKLNGALALQVRANSYTADGNWLLEIQAYMNPSSGNGSTYFDAWSNVLIEPLGPQSSVLGIYTGALTTDPSSLGYISGPIAL
jgi:hypothetical protein